MNANAKRHSVVYPRGFSLVEIVLALGVISFALVAIIGLLPIGLSSGRASIQESRANHLVDQIFATVRSQPFNSVSLTALNSTSSPVNLSTENTAFGTNGIILHATYDGSFVSTNDYFTIELRFRNAPEGIVSGAASELRVQVSSRETGAATMDYVSIISSQ